MGFDIQYQSLETKRTNIVDGIASLSFLDGYYPYGETKLDDFSLPGSVDCKQQSLASTSPSSPSSQRSHSSFQSFNTDLLLTDGTVSSFSIQQGPLKPNNFETSFHIQSDESRQAFLLQSNSKWYSKPNHSVINEDKAFDLMNSRVFYPHIQEEKVSNDSWKQTCFLPDCDQVKDTFGHEDRRFWHQSNHFGQQYSDLPIERYNVEPIKSHNRSFCDQNITTEQSRLPGYIYAPQPVYVNREKQLNTGTNSDVNAFTHEKFQYDDPNRLLNKTISSSTPSPVPFSTDSDVFRSCTDEHHGEHRYTYSEESRQRPTDNFASSSKDTYHGDSFNSFSEQSHLSKQNMSRHSQGFSNYSRTDISNDYVDQNLMSTKFVYIVKFKHLQRNFVASHSLSRDLKVGCYVKVEADRGEDLGIIINCISQGGRKNFNQNFQPGFENNTPNNSPESSSVRNSSLKKCNDMNKIIRLATNDEVTLLSLKTEEESKLLKVCREKAQQRNLSMNIIDAEFQFDRNKLTFYFKANGRVDFRELVRDFFSMYKIRIWMQQIDKET